jgi:hypothetical protein
MISTLDRYLVLTLKGRHRHIPSGYTVAFVLLSQTVGLSTALNFFFAALVLTPTPLSKDLSAGKEGSLRIPHPFVLLTPALLGFGWIAVLPSFVDLPIWPVICYVGYLAIPQLLAILPQVHHFAPDQIEPPC